MHAAEPQLRAGPTGKELLLLMAASFAFVLVLVLSLVDRTSLSLAQLRLSQLLTITLLTGAALLVIAVVWRTVRHARSITTRAERELHDVKRRLAATEAVIRAEPQVLVFWEHGEGLRVVSSNLTSVPGVPADQAELLRFSGWLDGRSADDLKAALDRLFGEGRAFNLFIRTAMGGHLEADGRAASGRAVLRFRDVAGYKADLIRIIDQHRQLSREINACRSLLDALPVPVWLRGSAGGLEWVNAAYVRAVDSSGAEEVLTRQIELLESRERSAVERTLRGGKPYRKRAPIVVGGERKAHDVIAVGLGDGAAAAAAIDVAAIEDARGQLDRELAAFDRTLDKVATAVAIFGPDQRLQFFNEAFARMWRLDRQWLRAKPTDGEILDRLRELSRLPAVVDYRRWKAGRLDIYKKNGGGVPEDWWHLPDGRMVHVLAEQRPDGGVTILYDDATERLALESRYHTLIGVQRETLDSLKEGVAVFATDGRLKLYNSAFAGIWKLSRASLDEGPHIDGIVKQARVLFEDDRTWARLAWSITSLGDEREQLSGQMVRADGSVIEFATAPLPDGATLVTFADVSAAKRYERALIERNEALVASDRLKNQFISHISYELRTPLTNIIGFSELMASPRTGPLNERQRDYLGDITSSSRTLLSIIDDILDLATIDAGALELKLGPADVRRTIDDAVLGVRDRAARAKVALSIDVAPDVSGFIVDEARVRQILYNLLSNAVGFSPADSTVSVLARREGAMIALTVEDRGIGIPKEQQSRVFDRFESRSQGGKHRGAGLGLSIVKSLVELHEGTLRLDSEPGRGTRVTVLLPERADGGALLRQEIEAALQRA